jgi:hypothetical protein
MDAIGVSLFRVRRGPAKQVCLNFAVVQPDQQWMAWYAFFQDGGGEVALRHEFPAVDRLGGGFGPKHHTFRRTTVLLPLPQPVDELAGAPADQEAHPVPATLFATSGHGSDVYVSLKIIRPLVDIELHGPDPGILLVPKLHMQGHLPKDMRAKTFSGVAMGWPAERFRPNMLKAPKSSADDMLHRYQ